MRLRGFEGMSVCGKLKVSEMLQIREEVAVEVEAAMENHIAA